MCIYGCAVWLCFPLTGIYLHMKKKYCSFELCVYVKYAYAYSFPVAIRLIRFSTPCSIRYADLISIHELSLHFKGCHDFHQKLIFILLIVYSFLFIRRIFFQSIRLDLTVKRNIKNVVGCHGNDNLTMNESKRKYFSNPSKCRVWNIRISYITYIKSTSLFIFYP